MNEHQCAAFWWNEVVGPNRFVTSIVDALLDKNNVVLDLPDDLPWRHAMRSAFRYVAEVTPGLDGLYLETVDVSDVGNGRSPGDIVLQQFVLESDRLGFRTGRETVHSYLQNNRLLSGRIVWVKGIDAGQTSAWLDFLADWNPRDINDGLFVIENRESVCSSIPHTKEFDYRVSADENSVRLFCWSILADQTFEDLSSMWRQYAVSILASLCKQDVEVAAALATSFDIRKDDIVDALVDLEDSFHFNRRGIPGSDHVLALLREGRREELLARIWKAQIETLFPLIEEERIKIVASLSVELDTMLQAGLIEQFGEPIKTVHDIELGTLVYLMSSHRDAESRLIVNDWKVRNRIHCLRKCRNLLAHQEICSVELVGELIEGHSNAKGNVFAAV